MTMKLYCIAFPRNHKTPLPHFIALKSLFPDFDIITSLCNSVLVPFTMTRVHIMSLSNSIGSRRPYKLVTVSRYPDKATIMVKRLAEMLDDRFLVIHAANCERTL